MSDIVMLISIHHVVYMHAKDSLVQPLFEA